MNRLKPLIPSIMSVGLGLLPIQLNANPDGGVVVNGTASFNQQGSTLNITNSPGTIINWQDFSVQSDETTRFIQQSADSAVLNRVVGQAPSQILGKLQSNGRVFIINPNGVLFGQNSIVDVSGLVASTLNLSNEDFLSQQFNFNGDGSNGSINNQGAITTSEGGFVYLIASDIENHGVITSPKGDVILAAGHSVQLVNSDNLDIRVTITAPEGEALNVGDIITRGGKTSIYAGLINQQGTVNADSAVVGENGKIFFKATQRTTLTSSSITTANGVDGGSVTIRTTEGLTEVSGTVSATGSNGTGGNVQILGEHVGIIDNANVDASGLKGGGTVLIGGDNKGANPDVQNALATYVGIDTEIHADAVEEGNGGTVIVWSDDATRAYGTITAKGGSAFGNGGYVETSGGYLDVAGINLDVTAENGNGGTWLLDPYDITITGTTTVNNSGIPSFTPTATGSNIFNGDINTQLNAGTSVIIDTTGGGADVGDITVNSAISKTSGAAATLTLNAHEDVIVNNTISSTVGALNVVLNSDQDASGTGEVFITTGSILTNGGNITLIGNNVSIASAINGANYYIAPSITGTPISIGGSQTFNITQAEISNMNAAGNIYIGSPEGSSITSGTVDVASATAIDAGARNLYFFGSDNTTIGNNAFAATGGILYFDNPVSGKTFTTGTGNVSANQIYITNNGLVSIGSGGLTSNSLTLIKSADLNIGGAVTTSAGNAYLFPYTTGAAISLGGPQVYNLTQADLTNVTANMINIGVDQFGVVQAWTVDLSTVSAIDFGNKNLTIKGTGNVTIGANNFGGTGGGFNIFTSGTGSITTGAGNLFGVGMTLNSANNLTIGSGGISTTTAGTNLTAAFDIIINGAINSSGGAFINATSGGTLDVNALISTSGSVAFTSSQNLRLNRAGLDISAGTINLTSTNASINGSDLGTYDLNGTNISLNASSGIARTTTTVLGVNTANLSFNNSTSGEVLLRNYWSASNTVTGTNSSTGTTHLEYFNPGSVTFNNITTGGSLSILTDVINIVGTLDSGTSDLYLSPFSANPISIDGSAAFDLTQGELTSMSFGNLYIGFDGVTTKATSASISSLASTTISGGGGGGGGIGTIRALNDITFGTNNFSAVGESVTFISDAGNIVTGTGNISVGNLTFNAAGNIIDGNGTNVLDVSATNLTVISGGNASLDYQITGALNSTGVVGTADLRNMGTTTTTTTTTASSTNEPLLNTLDTISSAINNLPPPPPSGSTTSTAPLGDTTAPPPDGTDPTLDPSSEPIGETTSDGIQLAGDPNARPPEESTDSETKEETQAASNEDAPQKLAKKLPICK